MNYWEKFAVTALCRSNFFFFFIFPRSSTFHPIEHYFLSVKQNIEKKKNEIVNIFASLASYADENRATLQTIKYFLTRRASE